MSATSSLSLSPGSSALFASPPPKTKLPNQTTPNPPTLHPNPKPNPNPYPSLVATRTRREASLALATLGLAHLFQPLALVDAAENNNCSFTVAPSGLAFCDIVVGYGPEATKGQLIKAHYVGKLENGKVFDSSYGRGKPLTFRVGAGEVIKGWDEGILGGEGIPPMLTGGKRTLKLPPQLGYGMRGAGCKGGSCIIPPDSTLFFDVEFVGKA